MTPRLLTRTHYQINEPAYLCLLVLQCTSPTRSEYRERVAEKLVEEMRKADRRVNVDAAKYAVDLGRAIGLLNANNVWTDRGHLLSLLNDSKEFARGMELSLRERLFFFRILLDTDGAAIAYFLRELCR